MKHAIYCALSLIPLSMLSADDMTFPEGKIIDHPSLYHDITPSAGPRVIDGIGMFLTGDYLYWTAREDNIPYATSGISEDIHVAAEKGKSHSVKFRFASGFKAGLGFSFGHDKWDMAFDYTWFLSNDNHSSTSQGASESQLFPAIYTLSLAPLSNASGSWKFRFNALDWELGRNFYVSKFLALRPFFGFKGTLQTQKYNIRYLFNDDSSTHYKANFKNDFWGFGIRAGLNTAWHLGANWSFYGDLALSALWGAFNEHRKDKTAPSGSGYTTAINNVAIFHTIKPVLELALGLRKEGWFCDDRFHIAVQGGWEEQVWFDQNQFLFNASVHTADLVLQGLTARVRFDF